MCVASRWALLKYAGTVTTARATGWPTRRSASRSSSSRSSAPIASGASGAGAAGQLKTTPHSSSPTSNAARDVDAHARQLLADEALRADDGVLGIGRRLIQRGLPNVHAVVGVRHHRRPRRLAMPVGHHEWLALASHGDGRVRGAEVDADGAPKPHGSARAHPNTCQEEERTSHAHAAGERTLAQGRRLGGDPRGRYCTDVRAPSLLA